MDVRLPPECWLLIVDQIDYYQTMINLSRVSKLFHSMVPDERWLIKEKGKYSYLLGTKNIHGKHTSYYGEGRKESNIYINGKREGISKNWYANGNRCWEIFYKRNKIHGSIKVWYENGTMNYNYYCNMGVNSGPFQSWYDNGNPEVDCCYLDDKLEGDYKSWYDNGNLEIKCQFNQGKVIGDYKEYNQEGILINDWYFNELTIPWVKLESKLKY